MKTIDCDIMDKEPVHAKIKLTVLATGVLLWLKCRENQMLVISVHIRDVISTYNDLRQRKEKFSHAVVQVFPVIRRERQGEEVIDKDGRSKVL